MLGAPAAAAQAASGFNVIINFTPANASCSAAVGAGDTAQVNCLPGIVSGAAGVAGGDRKMEAAQGYRLPDARVRLAGAVVELGEENFQAWGEYSSRLIASGDVEYVELTVTW